MSTENLQIPIQLPDGPAVLIRRAGVPEPDATTTVLLTAARRAAGETVFVMGPNLAAVALWAARQGAASITAWTENAAEAWSLKATFDHAGLPQPRLLLQADYAGLELQSFSLVLLSLSRGKSAQGEAVSLAGALLHPGGRLCLAGASHDGVRTAIDQAANLFGRAGVVARKGGSHAALAQRSPTRGFPPPPEISYIIEEIQLDGHPTKLVSSSHVFAWGHLDEGAAALIQAMEVEPGMTLLDLGCGAGVVGLAALRRGAHATLVDISAGAVESARRTLAANGYPDPQRVRLSWGAEGLPSGTFHRVAANPPFHQGHGMDFETARLFITEAARVLRPGGRLYLVANAFLKYEPWLRQSFSQVRLVHDDKKFRVWRAE